MYILLIFKICGIKQQGSHIMNLRFMTYKTPRQGEAKTAFMKDVF